MASPHRALLLPTQCDLLQPYEEHGGHAGSARPLEDSTGEGIVFGFLFFLPISWPPPQITSFKIDFVSLAVVVPYTFNPRQRQLFW